MHDFEVIDREEIGRNIAEIQERIDAACNRAGRSSDEVTLVAVTKTFPVEAVRAAVEAGLTDFGENRVQDFVAKTDEMPARFTGGDVTWHMIGHLQRNKARDVVERADVFHALDSRRLANELNRRADSADRILPCMVQVNVSGERSKFGLDPDDVEAFFRDIRQYDSLRPVGLMTLAAPVDDVELVRPQFRLLRETLDRVRQQPGYEEVSLLSMGMSGDFEIAIEEGATHVRIGSAIFGARPV